MTDPIFTATQCLSSARGMGEENAGVPVDVLERLIGLVGELERQNARLMICNTSARAASKRAGIDLLREEADAYLPHFRAEWEPLRDVANRAGCSAQSLASRARDLQKRGLVESKWFGAERTSSFKVWRTSGANP